MEKLNIPVFTSSTPVLAFLYWANFHLGQDCIVTLVTTGFNWTMLWGRTTWKFFKLFTMGAYVLFQKPYYPSPHSQANIYSSTLLSSFIFMPILQVFTLLTMLRSWNYLFRLQLKLGLWCSTSFRSDFSLVVPVCTAFKLKCRVFMIFWKEYWFRSLAWSCSRWIMIKYMVLL
jgi:hypothetical protein